VKVAAPTYKATLAARCPKEIQLLASAPMRRHCLAYFGKEVKPHWPDAWVDFTKTRVGYEVPINHHCYVYEALRPLAEIELPLFTHSFSRRTAGAFWSVVVMARYMRSFSASRANA
jgi:hypothetical protein